MFKSDVFFKVTSISKPELGKTSFTLGAFLTQGDREPFSSWDFNDNPGDLNEEQCQVLVMEREGFAGGVVVPDPVIPPG